MYSGSRQLQASYQRNCQSHILGSSRYGWLFQQLEKSRKELKKETTKTRRSKAMQHIKERKEAEDEFNLLGLQDEIWEEVLSYLNDPKDLASTWETHPKFQNLSKRHKYLRSQHDEFLLSLFLTKSNEFLWKEESTVISILRTFREVSEAMKITVDRLLEENFMKTLRSRELQPNFVTCAIFDGTLYREEKVDRMLMEFSDGSTKVFCRSLEVKMRSCVPKRRVLNFLQFQWKVASLLEKIGDQIWYFSFVLEYPYGGELWDTGLSMREIYHCIQQCIVLLPNLKWLALELNFPFDADIGDIQKTFKNHPLPRRNQLERIQLKINFPFNNDPVILAWAQTVILPNLEIIKALELEGNHEFLREMKPILSKMDLRYLACKCISQQISVNITPSLFDSNWNLKSLSVTFGSNPLEMGGFFQFLETIPSLESLCIHLRWLKLPGTLLPLDLPNLTDFELNFGVSWKGTDCSEMDVIFFTSLQFLVSCTKTKHIVWLFIEYAHPETEIREEEENECSTHTFEDFQGLMNRHDEDEMIKFKCGFETDLANSNIWHVFPELESVKTIVPGDLKREIYKRKL